MSSHSAYSLKLHIHHHLLNILWCMTSLILFDIYQALIHVNHLPVVWGKFWKKNEAQSKCEAMWAGFLSMPCWSILSFRWLCCLDKWNILQGTSSSSRVLVLDIYLILHIQMTDNLRWREFEKLQFYMFTLHTPLTFLVVNLLR